MIHALEHHDVQAVLRGRQRANMGLRSPRRRLRRRHRPSSLISLSAIGSGAVSNSYVPAVPFALALEAPAVPSFGCAAHPASVPTPATAAVATALVAKAPFEETASIHAGNAFLRHVDPFLPLTIGGPRNTDAACPCPPHRAMTVPYHAPDSAFVARRRKKPHRGFHRRWCNAVSWF